MLERRELLKMTGAASVALPTMALSGAAAAQGKPKVMPDGTQSAKLFLPPDELQPTTQGRLPLSWHKERTRLLKEQLAAKGIAGILLTNQWNIIYYTGCWHTTTERMIHCFIPADDKPAVWFYPAIDRDLIQTWWYDDGEMYFDWPDTAGAAPQLGKVVRGPTTDLWRWLMEGLAKRGYAGKSLVADRELVPSQQKTIVDVLKAPMGTDGGICIGMRMRKTPEELALARRAYRYYDKVHAFVRDLTLQYGTDLTDFEITNAAEKFGMELIMADLKPSGMPHEAVGIAVHIRARAGQSNGYPHPNQFCFMKLERGQSMQVAGGVTIGGYGGECYRNYWLGKPSDHLRKLWAVARDSCLIQKEESRKGVPCSEVAAKIFDFQVKQGVQEYIYHRPGHGQGSEGHQPPYISLGDNTILDAGMMFSVEPGLYDPKGGVGVNFSDNFVVRPQGAALQMSSVPWSEEWANLPI